MCGPQCVSMCAGVGVAVSVRLFLMFNCYRICDHGWSTDFLFHFRRLTDNNLHEHKRTEQTRWHVNTFPHRNTHTHTQAHVLNTHTHTCWQCGNKIFVRLYYILFNFVLFWKPLWKLLANPQQLFAFICAWVCVCVWCYVSLCGCVWKVVVSVLLLLFLLRG